MYAIAIQQYGGADNFELIKLHEIPLEQNQVRIEIKATSINPIDYKIRRGDLKFITGNKFPKVLGADFSGIVTETKSKNFQVGAAVYGMVDPLKGGTYADQIVIDEDNISPKPEGLSFTEAACLPLVGLAASEALCRHGKIKEDTRVLINGASGGVGSIAIQLAHIYTDKLTAICSTRNIGFIESMGVENIINYEKEKIPKNEKFDIIYDTIGNLKFNSIKSNLSKGGIFISNAFTFSLFLRGIINKSCKRLMVVPDKKLLNLITCLVDQDMLYPVIEETFSWKDMAEAHRIAEKGKARGKIAIEIN